MGLKMNAETMELENTEAQTEEGGEENGSQDDANEEVKDDESVESEESSGNGGESEGEAGKSGGEGDGGKEVEDGAGKSGVEEPPQPTVQDAIKQIEALKKELEESKKINATTEKPAEKKERTEEEWAKVEQETGMQRQSVGFLENTLMTLAKSFKQAMDDRFAVLEKGSAIESLAGDKETSDIKRYANTPEFNEYLNKFKPSFHSNKTILTDALYYAKGKGIKKTVSNIKKKDELHRKIVKRASSASGSESGKGGGKGLRKLTPMEESARKAANMSVEEYLGYRA